MIGTPEQWEENTPEAMKNNDRWLMWDKSNDSPRRPHWKGDFSVSYNDPDDWHSFEEAVEGAAEVESWGIGFVTGDDIAVIDFDGAIVDDDGTFAGWVPGLQRLVRAVDSETVYVEKSPSETGLHIPVVGMDETPDWWTDLSVDDSEHEGVDLLHGSFCTVTGDGDNGETVEDCPEVRFLLQEAQENITAANGGGDLVNYDGDGDEYDGDGDEWLTEDDIRDALSHIDADCGYVQWRAVGFAIAEYHYEDEDNLDEGEEYDAEAAKQSSTEIFKDWSRTADEMWDSSAEAQAERIVRDSWERLQYEKNPVTVGTLVAYAQEAGWELPDIQERLALDTVESFIEDYDVVEDRPERPDDDEAEDMSGEELLEIEEEWPDDDELDDVADAIGRLSDEDYDEHVEDIVARLSTVADKHWTDTHRELSAVVAENDGAVVPFDGELVIVDTPGRWFGVGETLFNFELEVESRLSIEGEGRMATVTVDPLETSESAFQEQIEPRVFNDARRFKDEILAQRFSTTIESDMHDSDVMDLVRKYISRQDVPDRVGQKQIGLARNGDEFVTPNGTITDDGWVDDPDTVYVEQDSGFESSFNVSPDEHSDVDEDEVAEIIELVTGTRDPERFLPVLGVMYAAPYKPRIVDRSGSFNLLFINGESGVGKTATLKIMSRLMGMDGTPFSATDTKFAQIKTLSSTRGVPAWLDEYKTSDMADWKVNMLHELLRKAATGGIEKRGTPGQTENEYWLRAPVVVSGETMVRGSAEQRRAVSTTFTNEPTKTGTVEYERFKTLAGDAVTNDDGTVTFPDTRYDLESHAVALYTHVAGMSDDRFEDAWFGAREKVSALLAEWDVKLDDMEVQGLQTIVFGYRMMLDFAESVGADVEELPDEDDLVNALQYVADVDGTGRETHTDQFLDLVQRATVAGYLEEDKHWTIVDAGKPSEELRLHMKPVYDEVSKYVSDHALTEDLLGSGKDYKSQFSNQMSDGESYVTAIGQNSPPLPRCVGIDTDAAETEIDAFNAAVFTGDDDDPKEEEVETDDDDGDDDGVDATPIEDVTESDTGFVDVTVRAAEWSDGPEDSQLNLTGTVTDETGTIKIVGFESVDYGDFGVLENDYVRIDDAEVGEWGGKTQLILKPGTTTVEQIQAGSGYTEFVERESDQKLDDSRQQAVTDGGGADDGGINGNLELCSGGESRYPDTTRSVDGMVTGIGGDV